MFLTAEELLALKIGDAVPYGVPLPAVFPKEHEMFELVEITGTGKTAVFDFVGSYMGEVTAAYHARIDTHGKVALKRGAR